MYELSEVAKLKIAQNVGMPFEQIVNADPVEMRQHVETIIGKKLTFPTLAKGRIRTIEEVDQRLDEILFEGF